MKKLLKPSILPYFTLGAGAVGLALQIWLYATGIDSKGLFLPSHPANSLLLVLTLVTLLLLVLIARWARGRLTRVSPILCAISSVVAAAGILIANIRDFSSRQGILYLLSCVLGTLAVLGLIYAAVSFLRRRRPSFLAYCVTAVYLMLHLICQYRQWSRQSQLQYYCFALLSSVCLMLTFYHRAALEVRIGSVRQYLFFSQAALFFGCLCLRGDSWAFYLTMAVWAAVNSSPRVVYQPRVHRAHKGKRSKMALPENVRLCLDALERAGHAAYVVGGCVRDSLLGLTPHDYDLCTSATPEQICRVFSRYQLVRNGEKHGTVGVVIDNQVYEITTFRNEGGYADGRHPGWVEFIPSIEEDLKRRDFTVNAIAYCPGQGYVDPWGGREDLENRILRAVGDPRARFQEDALRILRGVRFAARYRLTPEPDTESAMLELAPLMENLTRERVFDEVCKLLPLVTAKDLIRFAPVLTQAIPELAPTVGFDQHSPHHSFDVYTHTAYVTEGVPAYLPLRWAALLHDVGKPATFTLDDTGRGHFYGHDKVSAQMADQILQRLKAPTALREQVVHLIRMHMTPLAADKPTLRRQLGKYGEVTVRQLLVLQRADLGGKATGADRSIDFFSQLEDALEEILREGTPLTVRDLAINGSDLIELGFTPGPLIGACLQTLLDSVQDDDLENTRETLLEVAEHFKEAHL